jgi:hypothetical protein
MSKARDLANAGTALGAVTATELGYVDGVTSAIQTQLDGKASSTADIPKSTVTAKGDLLVATASGTVVAQPIGTDGQFLKANSAQADGVEWATVSQYALPSQTGNSGKFLTTNGTAESWGSAGLNWTWRTVSNNVQVQCFATNGSNIYVAGCDGGQLLSSTDSGVTWTARTSQFGAERIYSIAYGAGIFVAVGGAGIISSSTDGITWTARTSGMSTNIINSVEFLNGNFVAVGQGAAGGTGGITTSTNGTTWTKRTTPTGMGSSLYSVAYGNGYYVAVGNLTTTAGCYSTNLSTWTVLPASLGGCNWITFQNNQFITHLVNSNNAYFTGNNPTSAWTYMSGNGLGYITSIGSADDLKNRIAYYNNRYWFTNSNSTAPFLMTSNGGAITASIPGLKRPETSYNLPLFANGSASYNNATAILVNSNTGGFAIADNSGNIFTSF